MLLVARVLENGPAETLGGKPTSRWKLTRDLSLVLEGLGALGMSLGLDPQGHEDLELARS